MPDLRRSTDRRLRRGWIVVDDSTAPRSPWLPTRTATRDAYASTCLPRRRS